MNKNIVFFGTPKIAANVLQELLKCNVNIVGVVCQPDRKSNHNKIISSDVKTFALNNNLKLFQPTKANEIVNDLIKFDIDLIITCAYGLIIPKSILEIPKFGCVNLHPSLLPKYRGPSPIQFALLNGDKKTGVTLMYMDEKMDTGNIIKQLSIEIEDNETYVSLYDKLSYLCGELITQEIDNLFNTNVYSLKQDETLATYTTKITREDEHIKWNDSSLKIIHRINALYDKPYAFVLYKGIEIKIIKAKINNEPLYGATGEILGINKNGITVKTSDGSIDITKIQFPSKKPVEVKDFVNGNKILNVHNFFE